MTLHKFWLPTLNSTNTKQDKDQKTEQLFEVHNPEIHVSMSSAVNVFCYLQALEKVPRAKKVARFGPPEWITWFNHHLVAHVLLYNMRLAVADAGFVEGGFVTILRAKCVQKFWGHTHFQVSLREASCPTCQSIHFWSRPLLRHAEVSYRSRFLSSLPIQDRGGTI